LPDIDGVVGFADVDATEHTHAAQRFGVSSYPQIFVFQNGGELMGTYRGPRTHEALKSFATRLTVEPPTRVSGWSEVESIAAREGVVFALREDSPAVMEVFSAAAMQLRLNVTTLVFPAAEGDEVEVPANTIVSVESGEGVVASASGDALASGPALAEWMLARRFPILAHIGPSNFGELANSGKLLVMGVLDGVSRTSTANKAFSKAMHDLADPRTSELSSSARSSFHFGTLNGVQWASFVEQFNVKQSDLPTMIVLDAPAKKFWGDAEVDEGDEMASWLQSIANGDVAAQREGMYGLPGPAITWIYDNLVLAVGAALALVLLLGWALVSACTALDRMADAPQQQPVTTAGLDEGAKAKAERDGVEANKLA
jgi:hypothetical protein